MSGNVCEVSGSERLRALVGTSGISLAWFAIGSVALTEMAATRGFDAAVIDQQHGLWDRQSTHAAVGVLGGLPVLIRTAINSIPAIGEALDSGAAGVIVPLVETAEQAAAAVSAATFPPAGVRSGGGVRPLAQGFADYYVQHGRPLIGVMIETMTGARNAAAIATVPGLDFVFVGTGDLALSIGCFPRVDDRHEQACAAVLEACQAAAVPCGIFTLTPQAAVARREAGYAVVVTANDIDVVVSGFAQAAAACPISAA